METINGEWYMKGCSRDDPSRLKSVEEAASEIKKIGFLPLFSNDIPGFSVEERSCSADWWSGSPLLDPWEWRGILARDKSILYGKFFDRKAGFVSSEWFPIFANYRRNGYDFDSLVDEGLAPNRARKLMQPFLSDGFPNQASLFSYQLKELAGFGKGREKNFEGVLTDLEMQGYLVIADFRQRLNRAGMPYGWNIAVIEAPENKLGYEAVTAEYRESPAHSWARICAQIRNCFPQATDDQLKKCLGIRQYDPK